MASSVWLIVVVPAIIAFIFGIWVMIAVLDDVSQRDSAVTYLGNDKVKLKVPAPGSGECC